MALWMTAERVRFLAAAVLLILCLALWKKYGGEGKEKAAAAVFAGFFLGFFVMALETWRFEGEETAWDAYKKEDARIWGRVEAIEEREDGFRLILGDVKTSAGTKIRRVFCYTDQAEGLKLGRRITALGVGEEPAEAGNPGSFDYRLYCRGMGIGGVFYAESYEAADARVDRLAEALRNLKAVFSARLLEIAPQEDAGILMAVLLGDKTRLPDPVYELYRRNGISHLLAISGLHVSVIGLGIWKGFRKGGAGFWVSGLLASGILILYGKMVGFGPSVTRAVLMASLSFLAKAFGRTYDLPSALCVPCLILLIFRPYLLTQAGFQLSFLAVGAIFYPGSVLLRLAGKRKLLQSFLISLSVQMATGPVILYHSFELPPYGVFLNLAVIPLMTYVAVSGFAGLFGSFLWEAGGAAFLGGAHYVLRFYEGLCLLTERLPYSNLVLGRPAFWQMALYYGCLLAGTLVFSRALKRPGVRRMLFGALFWAAGYVFLLPVRPSGLFVTFLDVGQGDGIYLEADGRNLLVDCGSSWGNEVGENCLVPFLKSRGVTHLDGAAVSHGDWDHVSGIRYLLESEESGVTIGTLLLARAGTGEIYEELARMARKRGSAVCYLEAGDRLEGILGREVSVECLYPAGDFSSEDRNEESLVLSVAYGGFSMLLTGDVGISGEEQMIEEGRLRPVTVLKAGHHGSSTSSGEDFVRILKPSWVIFSYGEGNRYGHPHEEVVERFQDAGSSLLGTARMGAIELTTDGKRVRLKGYRN